MVEAFDDFPHVNIESDSVSGEYGEITQTFTYLDSVIHSSFGCEGNRRLGRGFSTTNSLDEGVWRCQDVCEETNVGVFRAHPPRLALFFRRQAADW